MVQSDHGLSKLGNRSNCRRLSASLAGLRRHRFYLYRRSYVVPDCDGSYVVAIAIFRALAIWASCRFDRYNRNRSRVRP
jgi:hypothetical protein